MSAASLLGHAHGEPVLLPRQGDELFAVGPSCTHYGVPLADGLAWTLLWRPTSEGRRFDAQTSTTVML